MAIIERNMAGLCYCSLICLFFFFFQESLACRPNVEVEHVGYRHYILLPYFLPNMFLLLAYYPLFWEMTSVKELQNSTMLDGDGCFGDVFLCIQMTKSCIMWTLYLYLTSFLLSLLFWEITPACEVTDF